MSPRPVDGTGAGQERRSAASTKDRTLRLRSRPMAEVAARGRVITPSGLIDGEVLVDAGRIVEVRPHADVPERWVCPGFIDLQINGSDGIDLASEPGRIPELARLLPAEGVTAFCPTIITGPPHVRLGALRPSVAMSAVDPGAALPLGLHLEGPVIAPIRRGAHPERHLCSPAQVEREGWSRRRGVAMVTLAPELPGAHDLIAALADEGVTVAVGHTDGRCEDIADAFERGVTHVTHLFNAMRPFGHRDPGPIGAALADDCVTAGLICDLVHVHPAAIQLAWKLLGPERLDLVTDAVAARGTRSFPDGVRTRDGVLAGSAIHLDAALRNLIEVTGCSVVDGVRTVTATPAAVLGLTDRGVLIPGARADLTVLDHHLRVVDVCVGGVPAVPSR